MREDVETYEEAVRKQAALAEQSTIERASRQGTGEQSHVH